MSRTVTRQELYDLVWSTPMAQLAPQFDISDRGLSKICEKHQVPVPGRGYWAKIEAGQQPTKTPLWKINNPPLETVHIGVSKPAVNPYVAFAIEAAAKAVEKTRIDRQSAPKPEAPQSDNPDSRKPSTPPAKDPVVLAPVRRPHESIAATVTSLRSAQPNTNGEVSVSGIRIHKRSIPRIATILHHLAIALELRDIVLTADEGRLTAAIVPDTVNFEIVESRRREKHEPTPAEKKKQQDYERRQEIARQRGKWLWHESFWPEYDVVYSGAISLEINNWADRARRRWADGKRQSLESMIDQIADGFLFHLAFDKARREEREAEELRRRHLAHRRELHQKRKKREAKRYAFLRYLARAQREAEDLRKTIANASQLTEVSPEYTKMLAWAEQRLEFLEAQNRIEVISANLRDQRLFPEPDDLFDPEGDPPPKTGYWD